MVPPMHRTQILLDPEQHRILAEVASQNDRSLSDLVREIIQQWIAARDRDTQRLHELQAINELSQLRRKVKEKSGHHSGDSPIKKEIIIRALDELPSESLEAVAEFVNFLQAKAHTEEKTHRIASLAGLWQGYSFSEQEIRAVRHEAWKNLGDAVDG